MTCNGCVSSVKRALLEIDGVEDVKISLEKSEAEISFSSHTPLTNIKSVLKPKYTISEKPRTSVEITTIPTEKSKIEQLKPLFLIFLYLFGAVFLLNAKDRIVSEAMLDFMGLFYVVFSFFKFLDLKGFPDSFRMYDPLAKIFPIYGWLYPFIELILGILFLMRFQITTALVVTIVILGLTTIGVSKALFAKKSIRCACLGTALKLPMTEATFIENAIMLVMAVILLVQTIMA